MSNRPLILSNLPNALFAIASVTRGEISWFLNSQQGISPQEKIKLGEIAFSPGDTFEFSEGKIFPYLVQYLPRGMLQRQMD